MRHKDRELQCPPKPLLVDQEGRLSMGAEIAGEAMLDFQTWMAEQEDRLAQGLPIETPPPLG